MTDWYQLIKKQLDDSVSGAGAMLRVGSDMPTIKRSVYRSSSPSFNWAMDGGLPGGKVLLLYGPESSGKSLLFWDFVKNAQAADSQAWTAFYDSEFSFDPDYVKGLGVDTTRVLVVQSNIAKDIFDHFADRVIPLVLEGMPLRILGIDSIRAIRGPKEQNLDGVEDHVMADLAQLLPKATKKLVGPLRQNAIATILIQQVNEEMDPNVARYRRWRVPSGQTLKHFADLMVLVERVNAKDSKIVDEKSDLQLGHTIRAKVEKSKVGAPHRVSEFQIRYGEGIVNTQVEVADLAVKLGVIVPAGSTFRFGDTSWRGREKLEMALKDPGLQNAVMAEAMKIHRDPTPEETANSLMNAVSFADDASDGA